jgi:hypothetical protein
LSLGQAPDDGDVDSVFGKAQLRHFYRLDEKIACSFERATARSVVELTLSYQRRLVDTAAQRHVVPAESFHFV